MARPERARASRETNTAPRHRPDAPCRRLFEKKSEKVDPRRRRLAADNSGAERQLRAIGVGWKNRLFAGSLEGARRAALGYSITRADPSRCSFLPRRAPLEAGTVAPGP